MKFDKENYTVEKYTFQHETIEFRAYRNRVYVDKPVSEEFQRMNVFAPEGYFRGESINGYTIDTAPIFMPNQVGGYMPGKLDEPRCTLWKNQEVPNSIFRALQHGYVVAAPAIRGRVQQNETGEYIGKAPACVVDYKAAVRYLRHFAGELPGDVEKIITNGTSAGGALSSLMGATGNHSDYESYLEKIGAADERDNIFAASCYCPIINLEHADMAHEWQFLGVNDYYRMHMQMDEGGRPSFTPEDGMMSEQQIRVSEELAKQFPEYLNSLVLKEKNGNILELDKDGNGSFKEYMKRVVLKSAQKAMDAGIDLSDKKWLEIKDKKAVGMNWYEYVKDIVEDSFCVEDCYVCATFSYMGKEYSTDEIDKIPMDTVCEVMSLDVPLIVVKFNVYKNARFKEFYQLLQSLQRCLKRFINNFDCRGIVFGNNDPAFVLNDSLIKEGRNVVYKAKEIFNSVGINYFL